MTTKESCVNYLSENHTFLTFFFINHQPWDYQLYLKLIHPAIDISHFLAVIVYFVPVSTSVAVEIFLQDNATRESM